MPRKLFTAAIPVALVTILSFIIIYKAINVPVTYDEVVTWQRYTTGTSLSDIMLNPDGSSNNHILNSLAIKATQFVWGNTPLTLRLPNIIAFLLLVISVFALARNYFSHTPWLFWLPFFVILLNPYLIDFFSLARGYGMANAFMAGSITGLLLFSSLRQMKWYYLSLVLAMLAAYGNFTFLVYWAAIHILFAGMLITGDFDSKLIKRILSATAFWAIAFVALCITPLKNIQQCIQSTFGDRTSFYYDTILSETNRFNYGKPFFGLSDKILSMLICIAGLAAGLNFLYKLRNGLRTAFTDPFCITFLLLVLVWLANMLQVYGFKTSYLSGRTALLYYVLFAFVLVFFIRDIAIHKLLRIQIATAFLSLLLIWHFISAANLTSAYEWSFDAYTYDVMHHIKDYRSKHPETKAIELNLTGFLSPSFTYYVSTHPTSWFSLSPLKNAGIDTTSQSLYYYTTADHITDLKNYVVVKTFRPNGILLPIVNASPEQVLLMHK